MNERQMYALEHPLSRANLGPEVLVPLTSETLIPGGNLLRVILAIDR